MSEFTGVGLVSCVLFTFPETLSEIQIHIQKSILQNTWPHFESCCWVSPKILAVTMRKVKIHLLCRLTIFINRPLACHMVWKWIFWAPSMNSLELLSFLAEELFFLSHYSAVKWTRQVPVPYMLVGISPKELLHGATLVVHSTVALATVGMMPPAVVTCCCPFYFYL